MNKLLKILILTAAVTTTGVGRGPGDSHRNLTLNTPLLTAVDPAQARTLLVRLPSRSFVLVQLRSLSARYSLTVGSPQGAIVAHLTNEDAFSYPLFAFASQGAGIYSLRVASFDNSGGELELNLSEISPLSKSSTARVQAYQKLQSADRLFATGKSGSLSDLKNALRLYTEAASDFDSLADRQGQAAALYGQGLVNDYRGLSDMAQGLLRNALELAEGVSDARKVPVWFAIADSLVGSTQYDAAEEYLQKATESSRASGDLHFLANCVQDAGLIALEKGKKKEALQLYGEALAESRQARDDLTSAIVEGNIGFAYEEAGEYAEALPHLEAALREEKRLPDRKNEAITLDNIGTAYSFSGDAERARQAYQDSLGLYERVGILSGQNNELSSLAFLDFGAGRYERAIPAYNQALAVQEELHDLAAQAATLASLGTCFYQMADYTQALSFAQRSREAYGHIGDKHGEAQAILVLALTHAALGNNQDAEALYNAALADSEQVGDRATAAEILASIGQLYQSEGKDKEARPFLDGALKAFVDLKNSYGEAYVLTSIGLTHLDSNEPNDANIALERALNLSQQLNNPSREAIILNAIGSVRLRERDFGVAVKQFESALRINREIGANGAEGMTLANLMLVWRAKDNLALAAFYGKQAVNIFQSIRISISSLDKRLQGSFIHSKEDTYRVLADVLIEQGRVAEAEQVLQMLKFQEYDDFIRRSSGPGSDARTVRANEEETRLERQYNEIAGEIAKIAVERAELASRTRTSEEDARLARLEKDLAAASAHFQTFLDHLEDEFRASGRGEERILQVKEAQGLMEDLRELGDGTVALYTLVGEDKYRIVLIAPEVELAREFPIRRKDLFKKILAFRSELQDPSSDAKELGHELYQVLIGPIEGDLKTLHARTLLWSLDGPLRYIPISALFDGKRYLVELYDSVIFTPASEPRLKDKSTAQWTGLGLGVTHALGDFGALPSVQDELLGIFHVPGRSSGVMDGDILMDESFTEPAMRSALRARRPIVHIASHFQFNPGNDTTSFLVLGDGGHFTLSEAKTATNLFGGVALLTLSACNTALSGQKADGREVEGFAVLAQRQGAKAVLATLWSVYDPSTAQLMRTFYQWRVANPNGTKIQALRQAQLAMLRSADGSESSPVTYTHPYFWAPFVLIGNWK